MACGESIGHVIDDITRLAEMAVSAFWVLSSHRRVGSVIRSQYIGRQVFPSHSCIVMKRLDSIKTFHRLTMRSFYFSHSRPNVNCIQEFSYVKTEFQQGHSQERWNRGAYIRNFRPITGVKFWLSACLPFLRASNSEEVTWNDSDWITFLYGVIIGVDRSDVIDSRSSADPTLLNKVRIASRVEALHGQCWVVTSYSNARYCN